MKVGEPITYVFSNALNVVQPGPCLYWSRVADVSMSWFTVDGLPGILPNDAEGTSWICGHYAAGHAEGVALLAAYALARSVAA